MLDQYLRLPTELQASILSYCSDNDITCLSLTCKPLYALYSGSTPKPLTGNRFTFPPPSELDEHHVHMPYYFEQDHGYFRDHCRTRGDCHHCPCYDCELWVRLRDWMPKGMMYCRSCNRFSTRNKKRRNGACRCRSIRRTPNQLWTFHKHRGFGSKFWKKFYTEADLAKSIRRFDQPRTHASSYSLRERPKPTQKRLEHPSLFQYMETADGRLVRHNWKAFEEEEDEVEGEEGDGEEGEDEGEEEEDEED